MPKILILEPSRYAGEHLEPGTTPDVPEPDALILVNLGRAQYADAASAPPPDPAPPRRRTKAQIEADLAEAKLAEAQLQADLSQAAD